MEYTEEETFNALRKMPLSQLEKHVRDYISKNMSMCDEYLNNDELVNKDIFIPVGWTRKEYDDAVLEAKLKSIRGK